MKKELLAEVMDKAFSKDGDVSCKREPTGNIKGYSFRLKDGRYPVENKQLQWVESKDECLKLAKSFNAEILIVIDTDNKIADEIEIVYE